MLDLRRMKILREVALHGTISAAAKALSVTPSAVSQQIASLEREARVPLLERTPRSVRLTDAGRALVDHTEAILSRLAAAELELETIAGRSGGRVRLASFPTAAATILPPAIARFASRYPEVDLRLTEGDPQHSLASLRSGEIEIALVWEYDFVPLEPDETIARVPLLDDPVHLLVGAGHPVARLRSVALGELAGETWINSTPRSSCHPFMIRVCNASGFEPRISAETNDHHVLKRLVATGVGVALVPDLSARALDGDVALVPISPNPPKRRIFAAHRAGEPTDALVAAMLALLEEAAGGYERRFPAAEGLASKSAA